MVLTWISTHKLENAPRSIIARLRSKTDIPSDMVSDGKNPISFYPCNESFRFWFRPKLLSYRTELRDIGFRKEEEISITCWPIMPHAEGFSWRMSRRVLAASQEQGHNIQKPWRSLEKGGNCTKKIRPLSTGIVSDKQEQQLIADVKAAWAACYTPSHSQRTPLSKALWTVLLVRRLAWGPHVPDCPFNDASSSTACHTTLARFLRKGSARGAIAL